MKPEIVKYTIGLRMAGHGIRNFRVLAARAGITYSYLAHMLAGRRRPSSHQRELSRILGAKPSELFGPYTNQTLIAEERLAAETRRYARRSYKGDVA